MHRLSGDALVRARGYLETEGRPLERALYRLHFEGGPEEDVIEELAAFRNVDGGFGHALEPDVRTPSSSALATAIALRTIVELDCPEGDELVPSAVDYLFDRLDRRTLTWRVVPPDAQDHPHAPWWNDVDGSLDRTFDRFKIIPRALIVGSLHVYAALVPPTLLGRLTDAVVETVGDLKVLGTGGGSDLEYVAYLAEAPGLPEASRALLTERVKAAVSAAVVREASQWGTYCLTPLRAAPRPTSLGARAIRAVLDRHLDWTIDHQSADGAWAPTWSWFGDYPETWPVAEREWRSVLTIETLISLRAFGRV